MDDRDAVVVAARRTPIGKRGGLLAEVHPHALLASVHQSLLDVTGIDAGQVDLGVTGCVSQVGEQSYNIGRLSLLAGDFPVEVPGITVDAQCGSSHQAVNVAASMVNSGAADVVIASGVECMSRVPLGSARESGPGDPLEGGYRDRFEDIHQGESAERIADAWGISRAACDAWSAESQRRAAAARDAKRFAAEIEPWGAVDADEGIRVSDTSTLARLKPVFRPDGHHTAGSSSQLSDGAAGVVVMSRRAARDLGVAPMARVAGQVLVAVDPVLRLTGPIPATRKLLEGAGMSMADIDRFEVNEAFASVVLAWMDELHGDADRVNINGGAIALGHPVGATGARLVGTMVHELVAADAEIGLVTMCCGGGLGTGTLLVRE